MTTSDVTRYSCCCQFAIAQTVPSSLLLTDQCSAFRHSYLDSKSKPSSATLGYTLTKTRKTAPIIKPTPGTLFEESYTLFCYILKNKLGITLASVATYPCCRKKRAAKAALTCSFIRNSAYFSLPNTLFSCSRTRMNVVRLVSSRSSAAPT